jgi:hypothetical protein
MENAKNTAVNADGMEKEVRQKIGSIFMSPDSLRSSKDKALYQKVEALVYEGSMVKDGRFGKKAMFYIFFHELHEVTRINQIKYS